ncbi:MAG: HAMP domain-containing sensor histidine kinase [Eubacteriales bacterium]|nr:HAMP domain-containing sensor histidine kinase [Eubacteriales bacterium]
MRRLSIKMRITLWYAAVMTVTVAAAVAFLFYASRKEMRSSTAYTLQDILREDFAQIDCEDGALVFDEDFAGAQGDVSVSVFNADGGFLYGKTPKGFAIATPFADGRLREIVSYGTEWYVFDRMEALDGYGSLWLPAVVSADAVAKTYGSMLRKALLLLPALVLLSAVIGYLLTRRALRPVRQITATAEQIGESRDLTRRIALGEGRDEVYVLSNTFDRMFDKLEEAFEKEKQFTADASHELRTPTAVILSTCEYAAAHAETLSQAQSAISSIQTQAQKMSALLSQLLMLSRADQGQEKLQWEPVDMSELTELVAEQEQEAAAARGIVIHTQLEPHLLLLGDETLLMRLLINLLENAVKYGQENGIVHIALTQDEDSVIGSIRDNGRGIAPENLDRIWGRFYQEDASRGEASGCGLGLSMAKWIVEAHGGSIRAESRLGEGSVFTFILPKKNRIS